MADVSQAWIATAKGTAEPFELVTVLSQHEGASQAVIRMSTGEEATIAAKKLFPANPEGGEHDIAGVADNTELMYLSDPTLLHNLATRFYKDDIYTYTADILICINPFKRLDNSSEEVMRSYVGKSIGVEPPHVFAIADAAFRAMRATHEGQSLIISGESGAGKTETAKLALRYLTLVGRGDDKDGGADSSLETRIMQSNPILEAFGNSKTLRNNNSSRFGKFMEIEFDASFRVCSATIETYLLEKSRIIQHMENERSYHVFYQLCSGADDALRAALKLGSAADYSYTNQSSVRTVDGVDDEADFKELCEAFEHAGFTPDEEHETFQLLSALLHLSNVRFVADGQDNAMLDEAAAGPLLTDVATLAGVDEGALRKNLLSKTMTARSESYDVPYSVRDATYAQHALSKATFSNIFDWLKVRINQGLAGSSKPLAFIGVLDIYGFEFFDINSFEQLCINFANEKLQAHFNHCIFFAEQELYKAEAITVPRVDCASNLDVIELIEKPRTGVFSLLDEVCRMPRASDTAYAEALHDKHGRNKKFAAPRSHHAKRGSKAKAVKSFTPSEAFVIKHFAGDVTYCVAGFLDKNMDPLQDEVSAMLHASSVPLLAHIFTPAPEPAGAKGRGGARKKKKATVGGMFVKQLGKLTATLEATHSHFIRCIKPNVTKKAGEFEGAKVLDQLRCGGMMEVLKLMSEGFPTRCPIERLHTRYVSAMPASIQALSPGDFVAFLLTCLNISKDAFRIGLTKVFFRAGQFAVIDKLTSNDDLGPQIAAQCSRWLALKRFKRAVFGVVACNTMAARLRAKRAEENFARAAGVAHMITKTMLPLERRAKLHVEKEHVARFERLAVAAGVMHVAARVLLPAERRAKAHLQEMRQLKAEAEVREKEARFQRLAMAGGVMNVAARGLLPAERRAKQHLQEEHERRLAEEAQARAQLDAAEAALLAEQQKAEALHRQEEARKAAAARRIKEAEEAAAAAAQRLKEEAQQEARSQASAAELAREKAAAVKGAEVLRAREAVGRRHWQHARVCAQAHTHLLSAAAHRTATKRALKEAQRKEEDVDAMHEEHQEVQKQIEELTSPKAAAAARSSSSAGRAPPPRMDAPKANASSSEGELLLGGSWRRVYSEVYHKFYYVNVETNDTSWVLPTEFGEDDDDADASLIHIPASAPHGFHYYTLPSLKTELVFTAADLTQHIHKINVNTHVSRVDVDKGWLPITVIPDFKELLEQAGAREPQADDMGAPPDMPADAIVHEMVGPGKYRVLVKKVNVSQASDPRSEQVDHLSAGEVVEVTHVVRTYDGAVRVQTRYGWVSMYSSHTGKQLLESVPDGTPMSEDDAIADPEKLSLKDEIMVMKTGRWRKAVVIKNNTKKHPRLIKVHYDSFAKKYDEWISWDDKERFGEMCYSSESEYSSSGSEGGGED